MILFQIPFIKYPNRIFERLRLKIHNRQEKSIKTRASRTTGAKGSNSIARNSRLQKTDDHTERIRLQVSANKQVTGGR